MGSVKDLVVLKTPTRECPGLGRFIFSDRYSVFDWGEMPDHIDQKGVALCITAAYFFEKIKKEGIMTHYLGMVENEQVKSLAEIKQPINTLETKLYRILKPQLTDEKAYDYQVYQQEKGNFLIPLEIIYRNTLPAGSSIFKWLKEGELRLEDLGLDRIPKEGIELRKPYLDISTKLEATDRYISWQEAQEITKVPHRKIAEINSITLRINKMISKEVQKISLKNEDGKFEFALDNEQNVVLVDVVGTMDECRFTYRGMPVSKEIIRLYYRQSDWYQDVVKAKEKDPANWKKYVKQKPQPLPSKLKLFLSILYCAFANEITGKKWFKDIPRLPDALQEIYDFIKNSIN
jgi:phosphoribosylaminoimidazole-succinocarboxamide synthase